MNKKFLVICLILAGLLIPARSEVKTHAEEPVGKLAIVIDDFGEDRRGVDEMLNLEVPLTIAVLPGFETSAGDSKLAKQKGHEVILHMPMENLSASTPQNYYGPMVVRNSDTPEQAVETLNKSLITVPDAIGVNIHMGTGVSRNKKLMTALMQTCKEKGLYFLDSRTIEGSVCDECARSTGVEFYGRDVFLEPPGRPNYALAKQQLLEAGKIAKEKGSAVAIGHVGPVGTDETARAIKDSLDEISAMGVEIVPLSKL